MMKGQAAAAFLAFQALSLTVAAEPPALTAVVEDGGVWIREGQDKVLFYQRDMKSQAGKWPRANYVHPLYDLDGNVLTEDFPADHPHHRGIFWAWHQVTIGERSVGDPWAAASSVWDVRDVRTETIERSLALRATVEWKSPLWLDGTGKQKPFVREQTTIRVHPAQENSRAIDFEIRLLALEPEVKIGGSEDRTKGYGGFSPRLRLPEDVVFLSQKGEIQPQAGSMEAGPWVDLSGTYGPKDQISGVAILCHPEVPGFPQPWALRRRRSMQNPVYPGSTPVALSTETPLVLRYRLVIHRGKATMEQVNAWQREYSLTVR